MCSIFWHNANEVFGKAFNDIYEAKTFMKSLASNGIHNIQMYVTKDNDIYINQFLEYQIYWTTEDFKEYDVFFENYEEAKSFYNDMLLTYQDDWYSVYFFRNLGQGLLEKLRNAVKL